MQLFDTEVDAVGLDFVVVVVVDDEIVIFVESLFTLVVVVDGVVAVDNADLNTDCVEKEECNIEELLIFDVAAVEFGYRFVERVGYFVDVAFEFVDIFVAAKVTCIDEDIVEVVVPCTEVVFPFMEVVFPFMVIVFPFMEVVFPFVVGDVDMVVDGSLVLLNVEFDAFNVVNNVVVFVVEGKEAFVTSEVFCKVVEIVDFVVVVLRDVTDIVFVIFVFILSSVVFVDGVFPVCLGGCLVLYIDFVGKTKKKECRAKEN